MIKNIILILAIISISLLSGCIDTEKSTAGNYSPFVEKNITTPPINLTSSSGIEGVDKVIKVSDDIKESPSGRSLVTKNKSNWCNPGSTVTVILQSGNQTYTVVGITEYQGREVCQAELVNGLVKSTKYFSQDGKFESMSSSASGNGSVSVEASTRVNSTI